MNRIYEQPGPQSIFLWELSEAAPGPDGFRPWLDPYLLAAGPARGAVIVFPGGGYAGRAPHEAGPIARRYNAEGFHAFVLHYRVAPARHPQPLQDAARAVRIVRGRAAEWGVDPAHVAVLGFSAGGHLAGSIGVHHDSEWTRDASPPGRVSCRPDGLILCYPVISSGPRGHQGSFQNLLGPDGAAELRQRMSLELQVNARTPPSFLWHTVEDAGVPVENSLMFAQALRAHGVSFELHCYPKGPHGVGLSEADPHVATWAGLSAQWLRVMGWPSA